MNAVELERRELQNQIDSLLAKENLTASERKQCDLLMSKAKSLRSQEERQARLAAAMAETGQTLNDEQRRNSDLEEFRNYVAYGQLPERRTYSPLTEDSGFIVPLSFYKTLMTAVAQYTELMDSTNVRLIETDDARVMRVPSIDLTSISSAIVGQGVDAPPVANPAISGLTLSRFSYRTNPIAASLEVEQDSFESITQILTEAFGVGLARGIGSDLVNGNGTTAPQGVLTGAANSGVSSVVSGVWNADDLTNIYFSVNRAYRVSKRCAWLMRESTYEQIRKLKDSQTRPLLDVTEDGETLLGKRILFSPDMPAPTSGNKSICFGDFGQYVVRIARNGVKVRRNVEAPGYAEQGTALYTAFLQADAKINALNGAAPIVYATTS